MCVACGYAQELIFEELKLDERGQAFYPFKECGFAHYEHPKQKKCIKKDYGRIQNQTMEKQQAFIITLCSYHIEE